MTLMGPILALLLSLQGVAGAPPQTPPTPPGEQIGFRSDRHDRMTVAVRIGGEGPFRFLVDTGADSSAVSRELAERLSLEPRRTATLHSAAGVSEVKVVRVPALEFDNRVIQSLDAPLLEAADMGADGILGVDTLRSQRIVIDFLTDQITLTPTVRKERRRERDEIIVTGRLKRGHLILTDAEIDGERVTIVIDTGAQMSIGNFALLRLLQRNRSLGVPVPLQQVAVTGKILSGELYVADRLQFDDVTLRNIGIMFADAQTFRAIGRERAPTLLLGMNALRAFNQVEIDLTSKKLRLRMPDRPAASGGRGAAPNGAR